MTTYLINVILSYSFPKSDLETNNMFTTSQTVGDLT